MICQTISGKLYAPQQIQWCRGFFFSSSRSSYRKTDFTSTSTYLTHQCTGSSHVWSHLPWSRAACGCLLWKRWGMSMLMLILLQPWLDTARISRWCTCTSPPNSWHFRLGLSAWTASTSWRHQPTEHRLVWAFFPFFFFFWPQTTYWQHTMVKHTEKVSKQSNKEVDSSYTKAKYTKQTQTDIHILLFFYFFSFSVFFFCFTFCHVPRLKLGSNIHPTSTIYVFILVAKVDGGCLFEKTIFNGYGTGEMYNSMFNSGWFRWVSARWMRQCEWTRQGGIGVTGKGGQSGCIKNATGNLGVGNQHSANTTGGRNNTTSSTEFFIQYRPNFTDNISTKPFFVASTRRCAPQPDINAVHPFCKFPVNYRWELYKCTTMNSPSFLPRCQTVVAVEKKKRKKVLRVSPDKASCETLSSFSSLFYHVSSVCPTFVTQKVLLFPNLPAIQVDLMELVYSRLHLLLQSEDLVVGMECCVEWNVAVPTPEEDKGDLDYGKEGTIKLVDQVTKVERHHESFWICWRESQGRRNSADARTFNLKFEFVHHQGFTSWSAAHACAIFCLQPWIRPRAKARAIITRPKRVAKQLYNLASSAPSVKLRLAWSLPLTRGNHRSLMSWLAQGHVYNNSILKMFEPNLANETTWKIGPLIPSPFGGRISQVWL